MAFNQARGQDCPEMAWRVQAISGQSWPLAWLVEGGPSSSIWWWSWDLQALQPATQQHNNITTTTTACGYGRRGLLSYSDGTQPSLISRVLPPSTGWIALCRQSSYKTIDLRYWTFSFCVPTNSWPPLDETPAGTGERENLQRLFSRMMETNQR